MLGLCEVSFFPRELSESHEVSEEYSSPSVDRIWLWESYNFDKIPYTPYSIYLRGTIVPSM